MKFKIIILLFIFCQQLLYSQTNKINYVTFEYNQSVLLRSVKIVFSIVKDKKVKVVLTENDQRRSKVISFEAFNRITDEILKITSKDITENSRRYLDGTTIELAFGTGNHVSFNVSNLDRGDENTGLKFFLEATRMILEVFDVKISEING